MTRIIFLFFAFSLIFIDQLSKYLIRQWGGFYICNQNIAWGIKIPEVLFWILWILIIIFLVFALYKKSFKKEAFYIILILSGAVSNIIDRLAFGCVIDFIDLVFWPVFNLADAFITAGALCLLARHLKIMYNGSR